MVKTSILGKIYWSESDFCLFRSKTALNCWKQFGKSGTSGLLAFLAIYYVLKLFMCQKGQNKPHGSLKGIDRIFRNLGNKFQFSSIIRIPIFSHSWSEQFSKKNAISELAFFQPIKHYDLKENWTFLWFWNWWNLSNRRYGIFIWCRAWWCQNCRSKWRWCYKSIRQNLYW